MPNNTVTWSDLGKDGRSKFLSDLLTYAATHHDFRDCCLDSSRAALVAIEKAMEAEKITPHVIFPPDFILEFVNADDCEEPTTRIIAQIPPFEGEDQNIEPIPAAKFVRCSYAHW